MQVQQHFGAQAQHYAGTLRQTHDMMSRFVDRQHDWLIDSLAAAAARDEPLPAPEELREALQQLQPQT